MDIALRWLGPLACVLTACGPSNLPAVERSETRIEPPVAVVSSAPPTESAPVVSRTELIRRAACAERDPCTVKSVREVAVPNEKTVLVVLVQLSEMDASTDGEAAPLSPGLTTNGDEDSFSMVEFGRCIEHEYILLETDLSGGPQSLARVCNDGHGAAGMGENVVTIRDGQLLYDEVGGSAWRWGTKTTLSLWPLALLSESSDGSWSLDENHGSSEWSFQTFSGKFAWSAPSCDPKKAIVDGAGTFIPRVEAAGYDATWKSVALGDCAARFGADVSATLSAVVVGDRLYVELLDDHYLNGKRADALELWFSDSAPGYTDHCVELHEPKGMSLRIKDLKPAMLGKAAKADKPLRFESNGPALDGAPLRIAIDLPAKMEALTLRYRDTDNGTSLASVLTTSELDPQSNATLGRIRPVTNTRCEIVSKSSQLAKRQRFVPL